MSESFELGPLGAPQHVGTETYRVRFTLSGDDIDAGKYDVPGAYVQFNIRPQRVEMAWIRSLGGEWARRDSFRNGSQIRGCRVLRSNQTGEQESHVEVWRSTTRGLLTDYAQSLPGLAERIAEIESQLPK